MGPIRAPFVVVVRVRTDSEERHDAELEDRGSVEEAGSCKWPLNPEKAREMPSLLKLPE